MTIKEMMATLEEPYRTQALENHANEKDTQHLEASAEAWEEMGENVQPSDCINLGFVWQDTPQGSQYWEDYFWDLSEKEAQGHE